MSKVLEERENLDRAAFLLASTVAVALVVVAGAINRDSLRFALDGDERQYHRYTWFYPAYQWVRQNTPADSRILVVVSSGHSYYLERIHRRGDPWISGVVDWSQVATGNALASLLEHDGYRYVIYEDRDWSLFPGGSEMQRAFREAYKLGQLTPIMSLTDTLFTSRLRRDYRITRVHVLERHQR